MRNQTTGSWVSSFLFLISSYSYAEKQDCLYPLANKREVRGIVSEVIIKKDIDGKAYQVFSLANDIRNTQYSYSIKVPFYKGDEIRLYLEPDETIKDLTSYAEVLCGIVISTLVNVNGKQYRVPLEKQ